MYKVYQDPEGTKCLEQGHTTVVTNKSAMSNETDEAYKKNIEGLNRKIKALRGELEKVAMCLVIAAAIYYILYTHSLKVVKLTVKQ